MYVTETDKEKQEAAVLQYLLGDYVTHYIDLPKDIEAKLSALKNNSLISRTNLMTRIRIFIQALDSRYKILPSKPQSRDTTATLRYAVCSDRYSIEGVELKGTIKSEEVGNVLKATGKAAIRMVKSNPTLSMLADLQTQASEIGIFGLKIQDSLKMMTTEETIEMKFLKALLGIP